MGIEPRKSKITFQTRIGMPPTIDLENDVILGENAKAAEQASSDIKSLEV